jgi:hypothetical protein
MDNQVKEYVGKYIHEARTAGLSDSDIGGKLIESGWKDEEVRAGFNFVDGVNTDTSAEPVSVSPIAAVDSGSPRVFPFLWIGLGGIFVNLALSYLSVGIIGIAGIGIGVVVGIVVFTGLAKLLGAQGGVFQKTIFVTGASGFVGSVIQLSTKNVNVPPVIGVVVGLALFIGMLFLIKKTYVIGWFKTVVLVVLHLVFTVILFVVMMFGFLGMMFGGFLAGDDTTFETSIDYNSDTEFEGEFESFNENAEDVSSNSDGAVTAIKKEDILVWKTITLGTYKTTDELHDAILKEGYSIGMFAEPFFEQKVFSVAQEERKVRLALLEVNVLFPPNGGMLQDIHAQAKKLGLELCPAEVGPQLLLQHSDLLPDLSTSIAMEPLSVIKSGGLPSGFNIFEVEYDKLGATVGGPTASHMGGKIVYCLP